MLVVHGDRAARALIADALRMEGFPAVSASHWDALGALDRLGGEAPRALLLDLDGRDAAGGGVVAIATALRSLHQSVPIIGLSTVPTVRDGSAVGAVALLPEPFDLDQLLEAVARYSDN